MSVDDTGPGPMNSNERNPLEPELPQAAGQPPPSHEAVAPVSAGEELVAQEFSASPGRVLTEDLRVPWSWIDFLCFMAIALGTAFLASMFLAGAFALFHVSVAQIRNSPSEKNLFAI